MANPSKPRAPRTRPDGAPRRPRPDNAIPSAAMAKRPRVRFAPPLEAALLSTIASKSGFLKKQADNEPGKWTNYFFVLKSSTYLYYYNTDSDKEPRGIIDLEFLKDVRFNAECLQRSVGGSEHSFRVTGQTPSQFTDNEDNRTKLRPLYLDTNTPDEASAWMDAIANFRFDPEREDEFIDLLNSMEDMDAKLTKMTGQAKEIAAVSQAILHKGKDYVCKLRGVEANDDVGRPRAMTTPEEDIAAALRNIDTLFDEMYAEANQQERQVSLLRKRETEFKEKETEFKNREADFKAQEARRKQLEKVTDSYKRKMEKLKRQVVEFEARQEELATREREVAASQKDLKKRLKGVEKECEKRVKDLERVAERRMKDIERDAERRGIEFEKRQKEFDKQQKEIEKKQRKLDKKLKDTPSNAMRFAAAIGKRDTIISADDPVADSTDDEIEVNNLQLALRPSQAKAKPKSLFKKPGFLKKKASGFSGRPSTMFFDDVDSEICEPVQEDAGDNYEASEQPLVDKKAHEHPARSSPKQNTKESNKEEIATIDLAANPCAGLPKELVYKESRSTRGEFYYDNRKTKETQWEYPLDAQVSQAGETEACDSDTEECSCQDESVQFSRDPSFDKQMKNESPPKNIVTEDDDDPLGTPREDPEEPHFDDDGDDLATSKQERASGQFDDSESLGTPKQALDDLDFGEEDPLGTPKHDLLGTPRESRSFDRIDDAESESSDDEDELGTPKEEDHEPTFDEDEDDEPGTPRPSPRDSNSIFDLDDALRTPQQRSSADLFSEPAADTPRHTADSLFDLDDALGTPKEADGDTFLGDDLCLTTPKRERVDFMFELDDPLGTPKQASTGDAIGTPVIALLAEDDFDEDDGPGTPIQLNNDPLLGGDHDMTPREDVFPRSPSPRVSVASDQSHSFTTTPKRRSVLSIASDAYRRSSGVSTFTAPHGDDDEEEDDGEADDTVDESLVKKKKKKIKFFRGKFPQLLKKSKETVDVEGPESATSRTNTLTSITSDLSLDEDDGTPTKKKGKWKGKFIKKLPKKPFGKSKRTTSVASPPPPPSPGVDEPLDRDDEDDMDGDGIEDGRCEF